MGPRTVPLTSPVTEPITGRARPIDMGSPRRYTLCVGIGLSLVAAGCGSGVAASSHGRPATTTGVALASSRMPLIIGGSPAERSLLARIARAMGTSQIRKLVVTPAPGDWHPLRPGDVELTATVAATSDRNENLRGEWEAWILGGAFRDRSAALGLPRVLVVSSAGGGGRVQPPGESLRPPADRAGLATFRRRVEAAVAGSGAHVVAVRVGAPDGYSADVTLQVSDPLAFLRHQLGPLQGRLSAVESDGTFLQLFEPDGRLLYTSGGSARLSSGLAGVADHRYETCVTVGLGGPLTLAPQLPCPSNWRPPPTTPVKPLALDGWESGGDANRGTGPVGDAIDYRPGTTLGLGFVLENPNGHAVTVTGIVPAVGPGNPIAFTGARIQIPPSRANSGAAAELTRPFGPEPAFRPFTIQPGDWVGVGLHYLIKPSCSAATAGTRVTENRTLRITYTLGGATIGHSYRSEAFTVTLPRSCQ
jgi:hypothetical protein